MMKTTILSKFMVLAIGLIFLISCTSHEAITFEQGVERINEINDRFYVDMKTSPGTVEDIDELLAELNELKALNENMPKPLAYLLDYRIKSLEAEKLHIEGWQWGKASTTEYGFGCKGTERILNSSSLRNAAALKGYESVSALQLFVDENPEEAKSLNLTQKDVIFLNASYYQVEKKAKSDAVIVTKLCIEKGLVEINRTG